jgi:hypothetical protein
MKKILMILVAVVGFGVSTYAGDCGCFKVTNVRTGSSDNKLLIVTIERSCSTTGEVTVQVVPTNDVAAILNETAKYVTFKVSDTSLDVHFTCSESGKMCTRNNFRLESCN